MIFWSPSVRNTFNIITLISSILLTLGILLQQRGTTLGASFGGDSNFYRSRRGPEKVLYYATIIFAVIFVLSIVLGLLSNR